MDQDKLHSQNLGLQISATHAEALLQKNLTTENISNCQDVNELKRLIEMLKPLVSEKREEVRKLKMVQHYRSKKEPEEFVLLIEKWRGVAQHAFLQLHELIPEPKPNLVELIDGFQVDHELVQFNADEETFIIKS